MKKLLVANWKSNPLSEEEAVVLAKAEDSEGVVVAPPYPFLSAVGSVLSKAKLGAQDVFWGDVGSYTGEISWHHLQHLNVMYVIVGHSERRRYLGETDGLINLKLRAALKAGLTAILCVGEPKRIIGDDSKEQMKAAQDYVRRQLNEGLKGIEDTSRLVVAYEPIWAIGTGHAEDAADAAAMAGFIKKQLKDVKVLYGGSVNSRNAKEFLSQRSIDGALIGGASIDGGEFSRIIKESF